MECGAWTLGNEEHGDGIWIYDTICDGSAVGNDLGVKVGVELRVCVKEMAIYECTVWNLIILLSGHSGLTSIEYVNLIS